MRKFVLLAAVLLLSVTFSSAQFTLTSIDYPGGTLTTVRGINNHGDIVGSYRITPPRHALLIQNGQFIPLAPETILGAYYSEAYKTNDRGDVVGVVGARAKGCVYNKIELAEREGFEPTLILIALRYQPKQFYCDTGKK